MQIPLISILFYASQLTQIFNGATDLLNELPAESGFNILALLNAPSG